MEYLKQEYIILSDKGEGIPINELSMLMLLTFAAKHMKKKK